MRRGELLIKQIQRQTENERVGTQDGISLEEYYQYLTDGVRRFQEQVLKVKAAAFLRPYSWSASGLEYYSLPTDILLKNQIVTLEYSPSGNDRDYYKLDRSAPLERFTFQGSPSRYFLHGDRVYVNAYPQAGSFRMVYNGALPAVDKRRATVLSRTLSSTAITALALSGYTDADYLLADHITIVDFNGTVLMRGIPYTAVALGVVTIQGGTYTFPTGSTCPVGAYACLGANASTHPQIDDQAESFLIAYGSRRILMRDSSSDTAELSAEELAMLSGIVDLYADEPDVQPVLVSSYDYFDEFV